VELRAPARSIVASWSTLVSEAYGAGARHL